MGSERPGIVTVSEAVARDLPEGQRTNGQDGWAALAGTPAVLDADPQPRHKPGELNLDEVERSIDHLLECYRDGLRSLGALPSLGRVGSDPPPDAGPAFGLTKRPRKVRRWVSRSLARRFLENHIRKRLGSLLGHLRIEAMATPVHGGERGRRVHLLIRRLEGLHDSLFSKHRPGSLAVKYGWLPSVAALPTSVVTLLVKGASVDDFKNYEYYLSGPLPAIAFLAFFAFMVLAPLPVRLGFWAKRAILRGSSGGAALWHLRWRKARVYGFNVPPSNTYLAEQRVFRALGSRRPAERPLDLFMSFWTMVLLLAFGLMVAYVPGEYAAGNTPLYSDWLDIGVWGAALGGYVYASRQAVRRRTVEDSGEGPDAATLALRGQQSAVRAARFLAAAFVLAAAYAFLPSRVPPVAMVAVAKALLTIAAVALLLRSREQGGRASKRRRIAVWALLFFASPALFDYTEVPAPDATREAWESWSYESGGAAILHATMLLMALWPWTQRAERLLVAGALVVAVAATPLNAWMLGSYIDGEASPTSAFWTEAGSLLASLALLLAAVVSMGIRMGRVSSEATSTTAGAGVATA